MGPGSQYSLDESIELDLPLPLNGGAGYDSILDPELEYCPETGDMIFWYL